MARRLSAALLHTTTRSTVANIRRSSNLCKQKGPLQLSRLACMLYGRVADIMHFTKINWENSSDFAAVSYRRKAGRKPYYFLGHVSKIMIGQKS